MPLFKWLCVLIALSIAILIIAPYIVLVIWKSNGLYSSRRRQLASHDYHRYYIHHNKIMLRPASQQSFIQPQPMVLSLDYWEQTGNALKNLFDLQCWASSVNIIMVVEPHVHSVGSSAFHFLGKKDHSSFRFQDLFNNSHWNLMSSAFNHSILVSMKTFLRQASKNVTFVQLLYTKHRRCKSSSELAHNNWFKLLESNGFKISTVCIKILKSPIADDFFRKKIFDVSMMHPSEQNLTIIFEEWQGLSRTNKDRLELVGSRCMIKGYQDLSSRLLTSTPPPKIQYPPFSLSLFTPLVPSKLVLGYLEIFMSQYMDGEPYVAVMFRSEKLNRSIISSSPKNSFCMEGIMSDYKKALNRINGTKTLLFTDSGSHGSQSLSWKAVPKNFSMHLQSNLKLELIGKQLDSALEDITISKDSVLMALLQSHLVARATCVVIVGGGSFQALTISMYANRHKWHECYFLRNSECMPMYLYFPSIKGQKKI